MENFIQVDEIFFQNKEFLVVRDDYYPFALGGNKARKCFSYEVGLRKLGKNAVVTTGGIQSNHCRAVATMAAQNGWKCHIVYHGNESRFLEESGNAKLVRALGASCEFVQAESISSAMDNAMIRYQNEGMNPYYIRGGGHDLFGGLAYVEAVKSLAVLLKDSMPDFIFLPVGTGSTQAGIVVGLESIGNYHTKTIGISIARSQSRATEIVDEFCMEMRNYLNIPEPLNKNHYSITDQYLSGGYEQTNPDQLDIIDSVAMQTGLLLDSTYSGKSFYGMICELEKLKLQGKVLFWNTGGIFNLLK